MKVAIGSDKSGFSLKEAVKAYLIANKIEFDDLGTLEIDKVKPYFEVASTIAPLVQNGTYQKAILVCGTGAGVSIVANKYKGVHAVACESVYSARMAAALNGAKIMCMGGWIVAPENGVEMAKAFLNNKRFDCIEPWRQTWLTNADIKVNEIEDNIYG
jgi:ribose 5-phosphate isomerase B